MSVDGTSLSSMHGDPNGNAADFSGPATGIFGVTQGGFTSSPSGPEPEWGMPVAQIPRTLVPAHASIVVPDIVLYAQQACIGYRKGRPVRPVNGSKVALVKAPHYDHGHGRAAYHPHRFDPSLAGTLLAFSGDPHY